MTCWFADGLDRVSNTRVTGWDERWACEVVSKSVFGRLVVSGWAVQIVPCHGRERGRKILFSSSFLFQYIKSWRH